MDSSLQDSSKSITRTIDKAKLCSVEGCRAYKSKGYDKCFFHSGQATLARNKTKASDIAVSNNLASIKNYLVSLIIQVERHKLKPNEANALNNMLNTIIKVHQITDLEDKIDKLTRAFESANKEKGFTDLELVDGEYQ